MEIEVGDIVRIRGDEWYGGALGVVTEVRELVVEATGDKYMVATAYMRDEMVTLATSNFELVSKK